MDRRTFLKTTTAAAGSSLGLAVAAAQAAPDAETPEIAAPALARGLEALVLATPWGPDVPVLGDAAARMATRLQQVLGASYRIVQDHAAASSHADLTFAMLDPDVEPGLAFFAGLPGAFGLEPGRHQAWLTIGGGQMLWDDLAARRGSKPLLAGHTGARCGLWANRPLTDAADLAGGAIALPGPGRSIARALGVEPVALPPAELGAALAEGRLAAAEWGNPLAGLVLGLPQAATHFYRGGIHRNGVPVALEVRLSLWERLGAAERIALEGVAARELALSLAEALAHESVVEQTMARVPTLSISEFPVALAAAVDAATAALIDEAGSASPDAARIGASYMAFRWLLGEPDPMPLSA
ncbi:MAG: hypothetical protein KJZ80_12645 [Hyphomicrobiaceae bacterium]|nr:hypothetical protein [Hyphomicrobiaceae bacterium]